MHDSRYMKFYVALNANYESATNNMFTKRQDQAAKKAFSWLKSKCRPSQFEKILRGSELCENIWCIMSWLYLIYFTLKSNRAVWIIILLRKKPSYNPYCLTSETPSISNVIEIYKKLNMISLSFCPKVGFYFLHFLSFSLPWDTV